MSTIDVMKIMIWVLSVKKSSDLILTESYWLFKERINGYLSYDMNMNIFVDNFFITNGDVKIEAYSWEQVKDIIKKFLSLVTCEIKSTWKRICVMMTDTQQLFYWPQCGCSCLYQ